MVSTLTPDSLGIFEHLDAFVFMVFEKDNKHSNIYRFDNKAHIFLQEKKSWKTFSKKISKYTQKELYLKKLYLHEALNMALDKKLDGIFFHDILTQCKNVCAEVFISTLDIQKRKDSIVIADAMMDADKDNGRIFISLAKILDCTVTVPVDENNKFKYYKISEDENTRMVLPIFSSQILMEQFAKENDLEIYNTATYTIRKIVHLIPSNINVVIDGGTTYGATIDNELFKEKILKVYNHTKNRHFITERLDYYKNLDNIYVALHPCCDFDNAKGFVNVYQTYDNKQNLVEAIVLCESYDIAKHYVDNHNSTLTAECTPVGEINIMELKELLPSCKQENVHSIILDANTKSEIVIDIDTFYYNMFGETIPTSVSSSNELVSIVNYHITPPISDKRVEEIKAYNNKETMKQLPTMNEYELLCALNIYLSKVGQAQKNENKLNQVADIYGKILHLLLLKMNRNQYTYMYADQKTNNPLMTEQGMSIIAIDGRYTPDGVAMLPIEMCDELFDELSAENKFFLCTDNRYTTTPISCSLATDMLHQVFEQEENYSDFMMFAVEKYGKSFEVADVYYRKLYCNDELYEEFFEFLKSDLTQIPKSNFKINNHTTEEFFKAEKFEQISDAYMKILEIL